MDVFVFSLLGLAILGIMVDIIGSNHISGIDFVYDLIVLVVVGTNIISMLKKWGLL